MLRQQRNSRGSVPWQHIFDLNAITTASLQSYVQNVTPSVSNYTITIDGYNYTLGTNPQYLNLSLKYVISNATALPFFGNSSIGSFYWRYIYGALE